MDSWIVHRPQNTNRPYAVRFNEGKSQKSFATEAEAKDFQARERLGLEGQDVEVETFGEAATRWIYGAGRDSRR